MPLQNASKVKSAVKTAKAASPKNQALKTADKQATTASKEKGGWGPNVAKIGIASVFPDFQNDGKAVNPKTGKAMDFSIENLQKSTYTPKGAEGKAPLIFVQGANQWLGESDKRAKGHADTLGLPVAMIHNASYVKETKGQNKLVANAQRAIERASDIALHLDLTSEQSAKNVAAAMSNALDTGKPAYFAGESQGTALIGQATQLAKKNHVEKMMRTSGLSKAAAEKDFEEKAGKTLHVMTFGNLFTKYAEGPHYLHISIQGDPAVKHGSRPDNSPETAKKHYLTFDQLFAGKDNFENHNMGFTRELLKKSCEKNGVPQGDLPALFRAVESGKFKSLAKPDEVNWPKDINNLLWDKSMDINTAVKEYSARKR